MVFISDVCIGTGAVGLDKVGVSEEKIVRVELSAKSPPPPDEGDGDGDADDVDFVEVNSKSFDMSDEPCVILGLQFL